MSLVEIDLTYLRWPSKVWSTVDLISCSFLPRNCSLAVWSSSGFFIIFTWNATVRNTPESLVREVVWYQTLDSDNAYTERKTLMKWTLLTLTTNTINVSYPCERELTWATPVTVSGTPCAVSTFSQTGFNVITCTVVLSQRLECVFLCVNVKDF